MFTTVIIPCKNAPGDFVIDRHCASATVCYQSVPIVPRTPPGCRWRQVMATKERILALLRGAEAGRIRFHGCDDRRTDHNQSRSVRDGRAAPFRRATYEVTPQAVFAPGVGAESPPRRCPWRPVRRVADTPAVRARTGGHGNARIDARFFRPQSPPTSRPRRKRPYATSLMHFTFG